MGNNQKKLKKLTQKDNDRMWGQGGPYSQVDLKEQIRILDDSISRIFLVVEAEINPFTFEYVKNRRERFIDDEPVLQLLDHAEYRGEVFGYVVSVDEVELRDEESKQFARKQSDMTIQTLIRMHKFVMDEFGLGKKNNFEVMRDDGNYIWNKNSGRVEAIDDGVWSDETLIGSPAGVKNGKIRFFIILVFKKDSNLKIESAKFFARTLKEASDNFKSEIEGAEAFGEYVLITVLMPFDVAPADFIGQVIKGTAKLNGKDFFKNDYFVSNVKRPTPQEIMDFIGIFSTKKKKHHQKK